MDYYTMQLWLSGALMTRIKIPCPYTDRADKVVIPQEIKNNIREELFNLSDTITIEHVWIEDGEQQAMTVDEFALPGLIQHMNTLQ